MKYRQLAELVREARSAKSAAEVEAVLEVLTDDLGIVEVLARAISEETLVEWEHSEKKLW